MGQGTFSRQHASVVPGPLTVADIEAAYDHADWQGWGYLRGRNDLAGDVRIAADAVVLDYANEHGWTAERLFVWMNSRPGRHFADDPFASWAGSCLAADLSR